MGHNNQVKVNQDSSSEVLEVNYKWNIPNFQIRNIYSEKLILGDGIECTIMLVPKVESKYQNFNDRMFARSYFTVFFTKVPDDENRKTFFSFDVRTNYKRRPLATAGFRKVMMTIEGFCGQRNNLNSLVWHKFVTKDSILELDVKFIVNDISYKSFNLENFEKERSKLSHDFALLYKAPQLTDMKLICANNEEISVNKALLASRSPVFAKMLNDDVNTYAIEDASKEVATEFLRFLYTDTISINEFDANTTELLEMAKKYEVTELANLCKQDLINGCKDKMDELFKKFNDLSCGDIYGLTNFAEINRCVKDLYRVSKNIN
ncbi:unnamed protein product [Chironomus riparius]|uniref:BTB domain-containing protein n=1 Tax=Chironomus riparius TaxID=315576 RepID=A0A9N9RVL0_9DIPT|nr:unnamed protein product [Chironomus riparius]